jgi:hypothetical protein
MCGFSIQQENRSFLNLCCCAAGLNFRANSPIVVMVGRVSKRVKEGTLMIGAESAYITWSSQKRNWIVSIHLGAEVIKRPPGRPLPHEVTDDVLRAMAVQVAKDDGYQVRPESVDIVR